MKIFLDDTRKPYDVFRNTIDPIYENDNEWTIVKNYEEFVDTILESGLPEIISFDHDLSQNHYLPENQNNIDYDNFHCGHIVPEVLGGSTKLINLEPICMSCNLSMGTKNLISYKSELISFKE